MDAVNATSLLTTPAASQKAKSPAELGSSDFFQLLITQIMHQDPFQPTSNEDLLKQISSIREIELSSSLTSSLQKLTGQQQVSSASSLIGQYVTGQPQGDGSVERGLVVAVRFDSAGKPVLQLGNGHEMPMDTIARVEPPQQAAQSLIGQTVMGIDQRDPARPQAVEAVVSGVRDEKGESILELESGAELRLRDVLNVPVTEAVSA